MRKCFVLMMVGQQHFPRRLTEVHESLSLSFHRDNVPNVMVMDGSNAQVQGDFRQTLSDAGCYIKHTEHYDAKSNLGEGGVRKLK
jgi:hypothetical protein